MSPLVSAALGSPAEGNLQPRIEAFFSWFSGLEAADQDALMRLVYAEHKVRDVVRTFATMPVEQRKTVFQRLGLPDELLSRMPPPGPAGLGEVEVEWQEWDKDEPSSAGKL